MFYKIKKYNRAGPGRHYGPRQRPKHGTAVVGGAAPPPKIGRASGRPVKHGPFGHL
jgi:hypothetical protein